MSNLMNFFSGGGAGSVPLRGLMAFPFDTPNKYTINGMTFLRSGVPELVDYDPSLQSWVDDNLMFVNSFPAWDNDTGAQSMTGSDTDGSGKWMIAGWRQSALPVLLYSEDDAVTWSAVTVPWPTTSTIHDVKSGLNGVWLVTVRASSGTYQVYRTANNGQTWTHMTNATSAFDNYWGGLVTNRAGVWMCWATPSANVTHVCRSTDNGLTWSNLSVGVASNGIRLIEFGGGEWALGYGGNPGAGEVFTGTVFSNNDGTSWAVRTVSNMGVIDFAYCDNRWHAATGASLLVLSPTAARWVSKPVQAFDWYSHLTNGYSSGQTLFIKAGLDGSMILGVGNNGGGVSKDGGNTFVKFNALPESITISPSGRAVGKLSGNQNGVPAGIVTGIKAAGISYLPAEREPYNNYNWNALYFGYSVMYVRIK